MLVKKRKRTIKEIGFWCWLIGNGPVPHRIEGHCNWDFSVTYYLVRSFFGVEEIHAYGVAANGLGGFESYHRVIEYDCPNYEEFITT